MKKKIYKVIAAIFLTTVLCPIRVLAGDINGNEQGIIDYVSGAVWEYEGSSYRAKQTYIDQLRNRLMADDMDLTQKEANNAILQINANVKKGVEEGYLEKISEGDSEGNSNENSEENSGEAEQKTTPAPIFGTGTEEKVEDGGKQQESGSSQDKHRENHSDAFVNTPSGASETGGGQNTVSAMEADSYATAGRKIDIANVLQQVLAQDADTVKVTIDQGKDAPVIIEQYANGTLDIISTEGDVIYESEFPVKNTGFVVSCKQVLYLGAGYILTIIWMMKKNERKPNK